MAASGGAATVLTTPNRATGEGDHLWPEALPGGRVVLFTITAAAGGLDAAQVAVLDLRTGTYKTLVRGASHAHFVPARPGVSAVAWGANTAGGYLVYAAGGTVQAVPFDPATLETRGTAVPVIPQVLTTAAGAVDAVVARDGTLAYVTGSVGATARTLVWVDRKGRETPIPAPARAYRDPRSSPDGTRIATSTQDQEGDLWVWDLRRTTLTRATFDPAADTYPVWTADGRRLIFSSVRAGPRNLFWQAADGTGEVERLTDSANVQNGTAVSPDGSRLIFTEVGRDTNQDVMQLTLDQTRQIRPLVQSRFAERNGIVSPDGRWLAYEGNDSGRAEIYVRPYPDTTGGRWQVSTEGGTRPLWGPGAQELFYVAPSGAIMQLGVVRAPSWSATPPALLVKEGYLTNEGAATGRSYDISPDGKQFLLIKPGGTGEAGTQPRLIVVLHWAEDLQRLLPLP